MRVFGSPGYLLSDTRVEVRIVYTGFLLLAMVGMATMALLQWKHIGPTPGAIAAYVRGGERAGEMAFPKTFRELVELTHFHAFIMGVVYLVLAHLVLATQATDFVKRLAIVLALAGLLGDLLGMWLTRYVSSAFAWLLLAAWVAEWVGFSVFVFCPLREMWFRDGRAASIAD